MCLIVLQVGEIQGPERHWSYKDLVLLRHLQVSSGSIFLLLDAVMASLGVSTKPYRIIRSPKSQGMVKFSSFFSMYFSSLLSTLKICSSYKDQDFLFY